MTNEQRKKVQLRQEKIRPRQDDSESSREEGPSKNKGKTIDPREWGDADIDHDELDVEAQEAALKSFKRSRHPKKSTKQSRKRSHSRDATRRHTQKSTKKSRHSQRPAETQPAAQIAPKSYLGAALKAVD